MAITEIATSGDAPGWIHKHEAVVENGEIVLRGGMVEVERKQALIENIDTWALDLATLTWTRRTKLDWQRWIMKRADDKYSTLWPLRMLSEYTAEGNEARVAEYRAQVEQSCGRAPDITLYQTRYLVSGRAPTRHAGRPIGHLSHRARWRGGEVR